MVVSTGISALFVGANTGTAIYLGVNKVWPPIYISGQIWYGFTGDSCVTVTINSSQAMPNTLIFSDGGSSGIAFGNATYKHSFGTGQC